MVRLSREDGKWYLTDGTKMINVCALLPKGYQITDNTAVAKVIGDLRRTQKLAPEEETVLKKWEEQRLSALRD